PRHAYYHPNFPTRRSSDLLDQAGPLTQLQDLEEQTRERRQMTLAKFRNAVVIWMLVASQYPKGHIIISGLLKLARRQPPSAVTIDRKSTRLKSSHQIISYA